MAKPKILFETFLETVVEKDLPFVKDLHEFLMENNYTYAIKEAKSGYVCSYIFNLTNRTVANYVFRKKGLMMRIYADHSASYAGWLDKLSDEMKASVKKAGPCKRLLDPNACSTLCLKGYQFPLDGEEQIKCRNSCFMFFVSDETGPYLREMMEQEVKCRQQDALIQGIEA